MVWAVVCLPGNIVTLVLLGRQQQQPQQHQEQQQQQQMDFDLAKELLCGGEGGFNQVRNWQFVV